ncbi:MAG: dodecin family protein [Promethearchaeota archaeon]
MAESVYKIIELVGTSEKGWEDAVNNIVVKAAENLRDIRIVEVITLDVKIDNNKIALYRAKVKLSFKFEM